MSRSLFANRQGMRYMVQRGLPTSTADRGRSSTGAKLRRHRSFTPQGQRAAPTTHSAVHQTLATVWRLESARIVATVARRARDLALAEELAQNALIAALEYWPLQGLPANPEAWLMMCCA